MDGCTRLTPGCLPCQAGVTACPFNTLCIQGHCDYNASKPTKPQPNPRTPPPAPGDFNYTVTIETVGALGRSVR